MFEAAELPHKLSRDFYLSDKVKKDISNYKGGTRVVLEENLKTEQM